MPIVTTYRKDILKSSRCKRGESGACLERASGGLQAALALPFPQMEAELSKSQYSVQEITVPIEHHLEQCVIPPWKMRRISFTEPFVNLDELVAEGVRNF